MDTLYRGGARQWMQIPDGCVPILGNYRMQTLPSLRDASLPVSLPVAMALATTYAATRNGTIHLRSDRLKMRVVPYLLPRLNASPMRSGSFFFSSCSSREKTPRGRGSSRQRNRTSAHYSAHPSFIFHFVVTFSNLLHTLLYFRSPFTILIPTPFSSTFSPILSSCPLRPIVSHFRFLVTAHSTELLPCQTRDHSSFLQIDRNVRETPVFYI